MRAHHSFLLALVVGWTLVGSQSSAAESLPDYKLAAGVRRTVLSNGLIVLVKSEAHDKSVALELLTRVGPAQEDNTTEGMATLIGHLLEHRLAETNGKPDNFLDRTGTETNLTVNLDFTELSVVTTGQAYPEVLSRVLQAYGRRPFTAAEIEVERQKMSKDLDAGQGDFDNVYDLFREIFYRYHPYRQPMGGDAAAVHKFTPEAVNAFIQRWYAPNRTILCVVGDVDPDVSPAVNKSALAMLSPVPDPEQIITWEPVGSEKEVELSSLQQMAFLFLGYPAPSVQSSDYAAMQVLNSIMGTGISSRLFMDIREERGLAYELGSQYPSLAGPSHFLSFVITRPDQVRSARHRMFVEMEHIRHDAVPDWEVTYGKWKTVSAVLASIETPQGKAAQLAATEAQGVGYQFTDRYLQDLGRVTSEDIRRVANRYLDNYTLLVARPVGTEPILPDHL